MANAYSKSIKANNKEMYEAKKGADTVANSQAKQATAQAQASASNASRAAYARHAQAVKEMGKVSETTKNKLSVNLGQNVARTNSQLSENVGAINLAKGAQKAKNTQNYYKTKSEREYETRNKAIQQDTAKKQETLKMFSSTIGRYDSVKACDKAIKKLKKSNDPQKKEKIAYIASQRAKLKAEKKAAKSGRGGGYYRRGWGYGGGYGNKGTDALDLDPNATPKKDKEKSKKGLGEALVEAAVSSVVTGMNIGSGKSSSTTHKSSSGKTHGGSSGKIEQSYKKSVARSRASGRRHWHL